MADEWDQFPDAPAQAGADPWADFPDAAPTSPVQQQAEQPARLGSGEPRRGRYITFDERKKRFMAENPMANGMFDMNPTGDTGMAKIIGGLPEMALSGATGAAGTLADVATMADPGTHDWAYQPRTGPGQYAQESAGTIVQPIAEATSRGYDKAFGTGPLARTVKERGAQAVEAVSTVAGAGAAAKALKGAPSAPKPKVPPKPEVPSLEDLTKAKNAAYKRAEETGVVISRSALNKLKVELVNDLKKEGLDKDLHPKSNAALKRILDKKGQLSLTEIETLRKIANDAKGSIEKSDARLGARIVDKIDDFEENLGDADVVSGNASSATAYKEARALNTRVSKTKEIGDLFERAELRAGANYSQAGLETALRQEFKSLALNKNRIRRFSPAEQAAIKRVAAGAPLENSLRWLGKFAPTGTIGQWAGLASTATYGPAGLVVPGVGAVSKVAARKMVMRNANKAEELMRKGSQ